MKKEPKNGLAASANPKYEDTDCDIDYDYLNICVSKVKHYNLRHFNT
jgi:hypothetical protein